MTISTFQNSDVFPVIHLTLTMMHQFDVWNIYLLERRWILSNRGLVYYITIKLYSPVAGEEIVSVQKDPRPLVLSERQITETIIF